MGKSMRFTPYQDDPSIFRDVIETFDSSLQKWVCAEEMSELIKELSKSERNGLVITSGFIEEFIDVCICMAQMEYIIRQSTDNADETLQREYQRKLRRLKDKIDEHTKDMSNGKEKP